MFRNGRGDLAEIVQILNSVSFLSDTKLAGECLIECLIKAHPVAKQNY